MSNADEVVLPSLEQQNAERRWAVRLRVYDITRGMARAMSPMLLGRQVDGVWHSGIEVYGVEYFYGGGVCSMPPAEVEQTFQMVPSRIIFMGFTSIEKSLCDDHLVQMSPRFTEATYDLLNWNCNHFTEELMQFLLSKSIPDYIQNQVQQVSETPLGRILLPILQQQQQAAQQAASMAGQRTLWTTGNAMPQASGGYSALPSAAASTAAASTAAASTTAARAPASNVAAATAEAWPSTQSRLGTVLQSVCTSQELVYGSKRVFLLTLLTIVNNLLRPGRDATFLRLKAANATLQGKVLRIPGGEEALQLLGFERETHVDTEACENNTGGVRDAATGTSHTATTEARDSQSSASPSPPHSSACSGVNSSDKNASQVVFVFKQYEKSASEVPVRNRLQVHKMEIEAFLAALDRKKQHASAGTRTTGA